jgi:hypothetical protein
VYNNTFALPRGYLKISYVAFTIKAARRVKTLRIVRTNNITIRAIIDIIIAFITSPTIFTITLPSLGVTEVRIVVYASAGVFTICAILE